MDEDYEPSMEPDEHPGDRTLSDACADGAHHACHPMGAGGFVECDCPCHDDWD